MRLKKLSLTCPFVVTLEGSTDLVAGRLGAFAPVDPVAIVDPWELALGDPTTKSSSESLGTLPDFR